MVVILNRKKVVIISLLAAFLAALLSPLSSIAGPYLAVAPAQLKIKTDAGSTEPRVADIRLGYEVDAHKFELAAMSSMKDDNLNELVTDIPSVTSLFYRYTTDPHGSVRFEFILGYSQVDIESTYVNVPTSTETIEGISYGIGVEEALQSIPQLKFKVDFIQLYRSDDLSLKLFSVGFRYEF